MIEVLLALPLIASSRLKMAVVEWTDPNAMPCRRNDKRTDPLERVPIADDPTFGEAVTKPAPTALVANAWPFIGDITQADGLS